MMPTMALYDPAIMIKVPITMTKLAQHTPIIHRVFRTRPFQLSYSHIAPSGCVDINVARSAPTSEIKLPKFGTAEAMMYATTVTAKVQESHVVQCTAEFETRCLEPFSARMNAYL